jgi:hypothetical protein
VVTMYVAPGVADSIRPEDVVRAEGESDEDYAERQTLTVGLSSIPHNARPTLKGCCWLMKEEEISVCYRVAADARAWDGVDRSAGVSRRELKVARQGRGRAVRAYHYLLQ